MRSSHSDTERVQIYMCEYWEKLKKLDHENLVLLEGMRVLLGLTITYARSRYGSRVYDLKPFYRGAKITVVGAISFKKVIKLMTLAGVDGW